MSGNCDPLDGMVLATYWKKGFIGEFSISSNHVPEAVLRIRIEKMRMRIQEKISMRMRIHALTELRRAK
jgi:hypothetical protein